MPPEKKVWVYDGTIAQYPENYLTSTHGAITCTTCHGGDDTATTRAAAHSGTWQSNPGANTCSTCHDSGNAGIPQVPVASLNRSLHVSLGGYVKILGGRGFDFTQGTTSLARFDQQCTRCHVANDQAPPQPACGFCHVSVPITAGGGFLDGHNFRKTPDMERNCTACHGSRIKDEFFGSNNALIGRNDLGVSPVQPDVHFAQAEKLNADGLPYGCTFCHSGDEMHGVGAPDPAGSGDRYAVTSAPTCEKCHPRSSLNVVAFPSASNLHAEGHLDTMDCQVCHAQPYKNCFGCHTDVDQDANSPSFGLPFYTINEGDPTSFANGGPRPEGEAPDALMTFRVGPNPKWTGTGDTAHKKYSVLRHVPVDKDVFTYSGNMADAGLIPNMTALPTWKHATPHNIQRNQVGSTAVFASFDVSSCGNCHASSYADHWLTDPILDAEGWLQPAYEADETAANAGVIQSSAPEMQASP